VLLPGLYCVVAHVVSPRSMSKGGVVTLVVTVGLGCLPHIWDFGQCTRQCKLRFGRGILSRQAISGSWLRFAGNGVAGVCECSGPGVASGARLQRLYEPTPAGYPHIDRDSTVCGADGNQYESKSAAAMEGVEVINCGPCGACSNTHDVTRFHVLRQNVSKV
jgi:hypothetical protein